MRGIRPGTAPAIHRSPSSDSGFRPCSERPLVGPPVQTALERRQPQASVGKSLKSMRWEACRHLSAAGSTCLCNSARYGGQYFAEDPPMIGTEAGSRPHALIELLSLRYFKNTKVKDGRINTGIRSAGLSADNF